VLSTFDGKKVTLNARNIFSEVKFRFSLMINLENIGIHRMSNHLRKIMTIKKFMKYALKSICLIVMIYQIIDITVMYLNFPFNVNIEVKNIGHSKIPSISFCKLGNDFENNSSSDLFELMNCSARIGELSDGKVNKISISDCKTFTKVIEKFDSQEIGKCFNYFNSKSLIRKSENYFIDNKYDVINFKIKNIMKDKNNIMVAIHSPDIIFFNPNMFIRLDFDRDRPSLINQIYFTKVLVNNLPFPYGTDCVKGNQFSINEDYLEMFLLEKKNNYLTNTQNSYLSFNQLKDNKSTFTYRENKYKRSCLKEYYSHLLKEIEVNRNESDISVEIKFRKTPITEYKLYPNYSFITYVSNIGSLMSMWLGLAVIDPYKLIIKILNLIKVNAMKFLNYEFPTINLKISIIVKGVVNLIHIIEKFKWKSSIKVICIICFFYQIYLLTHNYLLYSMTVNIEIKSNFDSNGSIYTDDFPSLSICDKEFFRKRERTKTSRDEFSNYQTIEPKHFKCALKLSFSSTGIKSCESVSHIITSYSHIGKCFTYFSKFTVDSTNFKLISFKQNQRTLFKIQYKQNKSDVKLSKPKWYLHPSNELPSSSFGKIDEFDLKQADFYYDKIEFKLLPEPFETQCFDYYGNKSQGKCFNDCLLIKYKYLNDCIPLFEDKFSYVSNNIPSKEIRFCPEFPERDEIKNYCRKKCPKSCLENYYTFNKSPKIKPSYVLPNLRIFLNQKNYISYIYKPLMTFDLYITSFGGLLGLWNGLSFIIIWDKIISTFNNSFKKSKFLSKLKTRFNQIIRNHNNHKCIQIIKRLTFKVSFIKQFVFINYSYFFMNFSSWLPFCARFIFFIKSVTKLWISWNITLL
jgi:hypothetical protein